jgi:Skp family chaperone for outer membrane proteins
MKTMFKLSAAAALLATAAAPAFAATVLTVDFNRVFSDSAAAKSGTSQLHTKYDAQIQQRNTALQTAAQAYQTQVNAARAAAKPGVQPSQATLTAVQQAGEKAQAAQDAREQLDQEVQTVGRYIQSQIVQKVTPIAEQIRNERKAEVVVPSGGVLASDPANDITALVIQRLDASFPNPSITLPTQPAPAQGPGR